MLVQKGPQRVKLKMADESQGIWKVKKAWQAGIYEFTG